GEAGGGRAGRVRRAARAPPPDDPPPFTPDRRHRPMGLPGGHEPAQQDAAAAAPFLLRPVPRPSTRLGGLNLTPWKDKDMEAVNLEAMLARFTEHWLPKKIAQVTDYDIRTLKVQ